MSGVLGSLLVVAIIIFGAIVSVVALLTMLGIAIMLVAGAFKRGKR